MEAWNTLVKSALLGTDRHKPQAPDGGEAVDALIAQLGAGSPDRMLLSTAAVLSTTKYVASDGKYESIGTMRACIAGTSASAPKNSSPRSI